VFARSGPLCNGVACAASRTQRRALGARGHTLARAGAAQVSCDAYRAVVRGDERFIDYFQAATPVSELARMNIGSRPAKRKAAGSIDTLRAIPWIFAWTQTRFHLPVWLGIGAAFQARGRAQCG